MHINWLEPTVVNYVYWPCQGATPILTFALSMSLVYLQLVDVCVGVYVCVSLAWRKGVCFVLRCLHEPFLVFILVSLEVLTLFQTTGIKIIGVLSQTFQHMTLKSRKQASCLNRQFKLRHTSWQSLTQPFKVHSRGTMLQWEVRLSYSTIRHPSENSYGVCWQQTRKCK